MGLKVRYDDNKLFGYSNTDEDEANSDERDEINTKLKEKMQKNQKNIIDINDKEYVISFDD